jgi:hypothetical protein
MDEDSNDPNGDTNKDRGAFNRLIVYFLVQFEEQKVVVYNTAIVVVCFTILLLIYRSSSHETKGICIFDISAIMGKDNAPIPYALEAQEQCLQLGHDIAVFSPYVIDPTYDCTYSKLLNFYLNEIYYLLTSNKR